MNKKQIQIVAIYFFLVLCIITVVLVVDHFNSEKNEESESVSDYEEEESVSDDDREEESVSDDDEIIPKTDYEISLSEEKEMYKKKQDTYNVSGQIQNSIKNCEKITCKSVNDKCIYELDDFQYGCPIQCVERQCPKIWNKTKTE